MSTDVKHYLNCEAYCISYQGLSFNLKNQNQHSNLFPSLTIVCNVVIAVN